MMKARGKQKTETALELANERLRLALVSSGTAAWDWDVKSGRDHRFGDLKTIFGIEADVYDAHIDDVRGSIHPDDIEAATKAMVRARDNREPYSAEFRIVWADGTVKWLKATGQFYYSADGQPQRMLGMTTDITERKCAQDALLESESKFRSIFQNAAVGMIIVALDGRFLVVNRTFCEYLGYTEEELLHMTVEDVTQPEDWPLFSAKLQEVITTGASFQRSEKRCRHKSGCTVYTQSSASLVRTPAGKPKYFVGEVLNVTEPKMAEEALRANEERLRLAQSAASMGAFEWNVRTGVNIWTPELEAIYGLSPGGFSPTRAAFQDLIHPDDRARATEFVGQTLKTGQPTKGEWRVIWPDGSVHWIAGRAQALMDESGEPSRMVGVNVDITERKLTEEKLREYERAVEGSEDMIIVVDRQYRYLMANRQFLKRHRIIREQVVGHFVYELANEGVFEIAFKPKLDECFQGKVVRYELRYAYPELGERVLSISYFPVEGPNGIDRAVCVLQDITDRKHAEQALAGMTQKLIESEEQERTRIGRELHDDINQRLAMLAIQLEQLQDNPSEIQMRADDLRKQVIELSKDVQALSHELHSSRLECLGAVGGIRSWCKEFAERQKMEIDFKSDVSSVLPFEIGICLFRVLQEALHNTIKHSGVKRIEVQLLEDSGEISLVITDSGRGFEVQAALQARGLGLTSMRERVRLVNGTIAIESKPGSGTQIQVRVPIAAQTTAHQKSASA